MVASRNVALICRVKHQRWYAETFLLKPVMPPRVFADRSIVFSIVMSTACRHPGTGDRATVNPLYCNNALLQSESVPELQVEHNKEANTWRGSSGLN